MSRVLTEEQKERARTRALQWYYKNRGHVLSLQRTQEHRDARKHRERKYDRMRTALKSRYGLSKEAYFQMVEKQNGVCAICGGPPVRDRRLSVDHNHATGKVRGLLCIRCNTMIGSAKESLRVLNNAADYLKQHGCDETVDSAECEQVDRGIVRKV